ncbi:hypothetical protein MSG28_003860 [Choristoneura fumiferana]|uniref:Uncharacterized protein n=1 Tax=Choristoneura fumiferana TaxID=7141 RepID=A0ACC0KGP0_CHOFU|nr:hypothetical protein MSG28_003860 [Choristoneura fumiferana]
MNSRIVLAIFALHLGKGLTRNPIDDDLQVIQVFDLTHPTTWKDLTEYFNALERQWKICYNCGFPGIGTGMHLEFSGPADSMQPAIIPSEYLLTRLVVIDVTSITKINPDLALSLEVARQWIAVKQDPTEPTLLVFKFGWTEQQPYYKRNKCICRIPGLSYELAQWIAANLSHVVGVATDAPSLESEETRELTTRTVANLLGRSGIYMIENVNLRRKIPETGCMAIAMPLKMLSATYVPTRLTCFCPPYHSAERVVLAQRKPQRTRDQNRLYDINLDEMLN